MTPDGEPAARPDRHVNEVADDIAKGVAETVGALLDVGVSVARLFANASSPAGREVTITPGQGPLSEIIQYGVAATANIIRLVPTAVGDVARSATSAGASAAKPAPAAGRTAPTVQAGSTLRIPLSIENPTDQPMTGMRFSILRLASAPSGNGIPLPAEAISFEPAMLTVAPKDFEKLSVLIAAPQGAAPGRYDATIGLAGGAFEMSLEFDVVEATAPAG